MLNGIGGSLNLLLTGIFLYSLGGFIKIYDPLKKIKVIVFYIAIAALYIMIYISYYNDTMTNIEYYLRDNPDGVFIQSYMQFDNSSLIVLMLSACIFEIFRRINIPCSKIINFLGASTFMVYLMHDNKFFYSLWNMKDWIRELCMMPKRFAIDILKWSTLTFFVGLTVYILFLLFIKVFMKIKWLLLIEKE